MDQYELQLREGKKVKFEDPDDERPAGIAYGNWQ